MFITGGDSAPHADTPLHIELLVEAYLFVVQLGSSGTCILAKLFYFNRVYHSPVAPYHVLHLGPVKDYAHLFNQRLGGTKKDESAEEAAATVMPIPPAMAKDIKVVLRARLKHFRLRDTPSCGAVDFMSYLASMTIEEIQLWLESLTPYLFHDLQKYGVDVNLLVMWYALLAVFQFHWVQTSSYSEPNMFSLSNNTKCTPNCDPGYPTQVLVDNQHLCILHNLSV